MHRGAHHDRAREGDGGDAAGQVDDRAVEVALPFEQRPVGQPDPQVGQLVGAAGALGQGQADLGGGLGRVDGEHHLVADHLHHPPALRGDHVERELLELLDDRRQLVVAHLLAERGEPHQVGEPHHPELALPRLGDAEPAADGGLQVAAPGWPPARGARWAAAQPALTTMRSSVSSASPPTGRAGATPATRALMTSTCDDAMRAIDDPITRLICSTRSAEATSPAISWPTSVEDLDVGVGEGHLVRPGHRVAERAPQLATWSAVEAGALARPWPGRRPPPRAPSAARPPAAAACPRARPRPARPGVQPSASSMSRTAGTASSPSAAGRGRARGSRRTIPPRTAGRPRRPARAAATHRPAARVPSARPAGRAGTGPEQRLAPALGRRPRRVEPRGGQAHGADAVVRSTLPQQRRPVAVPAHRVRDAAVCGRRVVHLPALAVPAVGHQRRQRQAPPTSSPPSTSRTSRSRTNVSSSAAAQPWWPSPMQPPSRRGWIASGQVQVGVAASSSQASRSRQRRSPGPQLDRGELQRQVGAEAGVADALEEGPAVGQR